MQQRTSFASSSSAHICGQLSAAPKSQVTAGTPASEAGPGTQMVAGLQAQVSEKETAYDDAVRALEESRQRLRPSTDKIGARPKAPLSAAETKLLEAAFVDAKVKAKTHRNALAESLCSLGDALYLSGDRAAAEQSWARISRHHMPPCPELAPTALELDPLWLRDRELQQSGVGAARALTLMHKAGLVPKPLEDLARARQMSQVTAPAVRVRTAMYYAFAGKLAQAEETARALFADEPTYPTAAFTLGRVQFKRKDFGGAIKSFDSVPPGLFDTQHIDFFRGRALSELARHEEAAICLRRAGKLFEGSISVWREIGKNELQLSQPEKAQTTFLRLVPHYKSPFCESLRELLGSTVQALNELRHQQVPLQPRLLPLSKRHENIKRLQSVLFSALHQDREQSIEHLEVVLRQRLTNELLKKLFDTAWDALLAPSPKEAVPLSRADSVSRRPQKRVTVTVVAAGDDNEAKG